MQLKYLSAFLFLVFSASSLLFAQEKNIVLSTENIPPYAYAEAGETRGLYFDIAQKALDKSGYQLLMMTQPANRNLLMIKHQLIDGIIGIPNKPPLFGRAYLSDPVITISINPITLSNHPIPYQSINDLKALTIGAVSGAGFEEAFPSLNFDLVTHSSQNVGKLLFKRIDVILEDPVIIQHVAQSTYPQYQNEFRVLQPPLLVVDLVVGFSADAPESQRKLDAFNLGLARIKENGEYAQILKRWNITSPL